MKAKKKNRIAACLTSNDSTWRTPRRLLDRVAALDAIALDPSAASRREDQFALVNFDGARGRDGLRRSWRCAGGLVFCNPPYGDALEEWSAKAAAEAIAWPEGEILLLAPSRTETEWFATAREFCSSILFFGKRLRFRGAPDVAPFPSVLVYFGPRRLRFRHVFADLGWFHEPERRHS